LSLRKAIGAAFLLVLLLLGARTCSSEMASVSVTFVVEPAAPDLVAVEAQLWREGGDAPVGYFRARPEGSAAGPVGTWKLSADAGDYELILELETTDGHQTQRRAIELRDSAAITVRFTTEPSAAER